MGLPVARVTDVCGPHPDILVNGSPNVFVNKLPLHRAFDLHVCPIIGMGLTLLGTQLVLVNGFPAARVGSIGRCILPNFVMTGSPNVSVGG